MSLYLEAVKGKWVPPKDVRPSFKGRNVLITGANVGLGFEAAVKFVDLGANRVILGVRTLSKGEAAKQSVEQRTGKTDVVEVWHIDMLDYATIKSFVDRANRELPTLDVAVLNAGVVMASHKESQYGYEQTMQVNVLSTTLLALLLFPKLRASQTSTHTPVLEIVGSSNQYLVSKLQSEEKPFTAYSATAGGYQGPGGQYNTSKLFVMYVEHYLAQLAGNDKTGKPDVYVNVVCPGATQSELARDVTQWFYKPILWLFRVLVQRTTEEGARTYISGIAAAEKSHGGFWKDDTVRE